MVVGPLPVRLESLSRLPPALPATRAAAVMAMRDELTAILAAAEVPTEFKDYLVSKGLFQVDQLALMASDENRLEDKIFPILTAASIKMDDLMTQIAVKKAWNLARTAMATSMKVHTGTTTATDILPHPTRENIVQTWKRTHSFTLSGERLLTEQLIKLCTPS